MASISKQAFEDLTQYLAEVLYENAVLNPHSSGYTRGYNDGKMTGIDFTIRAICRDKDGWYDFSKDPSQRVYDAAEQRKEQWQRVDDNFNGTYVDLVGTEIKVEPVTYNPVCRYVTVGEERKQVNNETVAQFIASGLWSKKVEEESVPLEDLNELLEPLLITT